MNENQKQPKRYKTRLILFVVAFLGTAAAVALIFLIWPYIELPKFITQPTKTQPGYYAVTEVFDGDTIAVDMDGRIEKVRMIGVDTPETHKPNSPVECGGPEASEFARNKLENSTVKLVFDKTNQNRDRYDRLLRYVYTPDGILFNKLLISEGYGFAYINFPFEKKQEFIEAEQTAKQTNKGAWGFCSITDESGITKTNAL
jgi:endonuclease YncB( thermonuclease family)